MIPLWDFANRQIGLEKTLCIFVFAVFQCVKFSRLSDNNNIKNPTLFTENRIKL